VTAKPPVWRTDGFAFSPYNAGLGQAFLGASNFSADNWRSGRVRRFFREPLFDAAECDAQHKKCCLSKAASASHARSVLLSLRVDSTSAFHERYGTRLCAHAPNQTMHRARAAKIAAFNSASIMLPSTESRLPLKPKIFTIAGSAVMIITVWLFLIGGPLVAAH
jgi:hypothetical protein